MRDLAFYIFVTIKHASKQRETGGTTALDAGQNVITTPESWCNAILKTLKFYENIAMNKVSLYLNERI